MIDNLLIDPLSALLASAGGLLLAFVLHATVLLALVWAIERLGRLKHPGWAEFAWRLALFGAFVSVTIEALPTPALRGDAPAADIAQPAALPRDAAPAVREAIATEPASSASASTSTSSTPALPASLPPPTIASRDDTTIALPFAGDALLLVLLLWLLGSAWLLLRMLHQARALFGLRRRALRRGRPASDALQRMTRTLAVEMGVAAPQLRLLDDAVGPLVLPGAVLLPPWAETLAPAQQRAMLAHELAHLRRRDPLWRPLQRLALAPLFFHPLAWHALRRLEALAETLCDRAAAERSGGGRALAECLAECLAHGARAPHAHRGAGWALAMAERGDGIVGRVRDLLETSHMNLSSIPRRWRWAAGALVLLLLIALPGVMVIARPGVFDNAFGHHDLAVRIRDDGKTWTMLSDLPVAGERFRVWVDEDVEFGADERDVVRMGADARFALLQTRAGITREIEIVPGADGKLQRRYLVDGKPRPFDADGRAWLASAIPEIYRLTGWNAGPRIKRLLAQGGVDRVLREVDLMRTDYARAEYLGQLLQQARLDAAGLSAVVARIVRIDSDYERRRAMSAALESDALDPAAQRALLDAAKGIESDFERAEWLIAAAEKLPVDGANAAGWQAALQRFGSDFERRRSLQALIEHGQPRAVAQTLALRAMRGMGSDFEARSVLETAARAGAPLSDADYLAAVDAIGSDFEKREALHALIRSGAPDIARSRGVLRSVRGIDSDFEAGEVLEALAEAMPADPALIEDYRAVTRGMASDFERAEAEKALDRFYRG
jgi:beta-lactamase regulating signal transducer with metallopeptidase domain